MEDESNRRSHTFSEDGELICPYCHETDYEYLNVIDSYLEEDYYCYEYECEKCGQSYKVWMRLEYSDHTWKTDDYHAETRAQYCDELREEAESYDETNEIRVNMDIPRQLLFPAEDIDRLLTPVAEPRLTTDMMVDIYNRMRGEIAGAATGRIAGVNPPIIVDDIAATGMEVNTSAGAVNDIDVERSLMYADRNVFVQRIQRAVMRVARQLSPWWSHNFNAAIDCFLETNRISIDETGHWCFLGSDEQWESSELGHYNLSPELGATVALHIPLDRDPMQFARGPHTFNLMIPSVAREGEMMLRSDGDTISAQLQEYEAIGGPSEMPRERIHGNFEAIADTLFNTDEECERPSIRINMEDIVRDSNLARLIAGGLGALRDAEDAASIEIQSEVPATRVPPARNLRRVGSNGYGNSIPNNPPF